MRLNTISSKQNNLTKKFRCNHFVFFRSLGACCCCLPMHKTRSKNQFYYFKSSKFKNVLYILFILLFFFGPFFLAIVLSLFLSFLLCHWDCGCGQKFRGNVPKSPKFNLKKNQNHKMLIMMQCIGINTKVTIGRGIRQIRDNRQ